MAYQAKNDRDIQRHIANTYLKIAPSLDFRNPSLKRSIKRDRFKIGFVSANLHNHTVGYLNTGYIQNLDRTPFEVGVVTPTAGKDDIGRNIESSTDHVLTVPSSLRHAQKEVASANYDLLFYPDIGMGPFSYFLAFARLAPVQALSWGHPVTTGIPNVDYFVSCDLMEPEGAENAYSEKLIRLTDVGGYFFRPLTPVGDFDRQRHNLPENRPLIACLQSCFKFHPDFDPTLRAILEELPEAILVLLHANQRTASNLLNRRLQQSLGQAASQVRFIGPLEREDFLRMAKEADVILDIPQWSGGRSGYECLAMGTPIVHKPGEFMRGRHTLAFYKIMGVEDCIVQTDQDYVDLAVRLVRDRDFNRSLREKISTNVDKLFERQSAVTALEDFFVDATESVRH